MLVRITGFNLELTAASGQCFRFVPATKGACLLTAGNRRVMICEAGDDLFDFSCTEEEFKAVWHGYFDLGTDYMRIMDMVPPDGSFLSEAVAYARGLRILRQEPFETLISFILSQRKSIPAIRNCVERLCEKFGRRLSEDFFAFPEPAALMEAGEEGLLSCGLGYRAKYVRKTAEMIAMERVSLEGMRRLPDAELLGELTQLPGVGVKVASCVMLFAYHRLDAFPVDVWIDRVLRQNYPEGFPFERYIGVSGILQQQLFCYARWLAGKS